MSVPLRTSGITFSIYPNYCCVDALCPKHLKGFAFQSHPLSRARLALVDYPTVFLNLNERYPPMSPILSSNKGSEGNMWSRIQVGCLVYIMSTPPSDAL